jgi:hypothetical protein
LDLENPNLEALEIDMEAGFYLTCKDIKTYNSTQKVDVGVLLEWGDNEIRVIIGREHSGSDLDYQYSYYEFTRLIHGVTMFPGLHFAYNSIMEEIKEIDHVYATRFGLILERLESIDGDRNKVVSFLDKEKDSVLRILKGGAIKTTGRYASSKETRKSDIGELILSINECLQEAKKSIKSATSMLKSYTETRKVVIDKAQDILKTQIAENRQDQLEDTLIAENIIRTFGDDCRLLKFFDNKAIDDVSSLLENAQFALQSLHDQLTPPKVSLK